jgi:lipid A ethanolaminephosphotransferase
LEIIVFKTWITKNINTQSGAILLATIFIMLTGNLSLFSRLLEIYPLSVKNLPLLLSLGAFFTITTALFFLAVAQGKLTRWVLALFIIVASQSAYYMDQFGVIVDVVMIENIAETNPQEFMGLLSVGLLMRTIFFGILPAWLVIQYCPQSTGFWPEFKSRSRIFGLLVLLLIIVILPVTAGYATFIREHKITRFYANPTYTTYSVIKYATQKLKTVKKVALKEIAQDAVLIEPPIYRPELVVLVVGETARADRFSLNGYHKETNPMLAKQDVVSLTNVSSCGTSTGVSLPCMFSELPRKEYDKEAAFNQQNALDVLFDHGVQILWRDNNSDSKGVATRMKYEDYSSPTLNPVCEGECRDIGMLDGLEQYIEARKGRDILIVLHQMGNHGPEYYRRYPKEFARFQPMCMTGELKDCTREEIDNSYDNAILYTDYFLSNVIDLLKKYDGDHATAMLYVSDHGESLGEKGIYLHAAPYLFAPKAQTHIPAIMWMGQHFDYKKEQLLPYKDSALSHDDLFCSLLVAFEIDSKTCDTKKGMLMESSDMKRQAFNTH